MDSKDGPTNLSGDVRFRRFDDRGIVVRQRAAEVLVVNEVAVRILELVDGRRTANDLVEALMVEFDADRTTLEADVPRFLEELLAAGLIERAQERT